MSDLSVKMQRRLIVATDMINEAESCLGPLTDGMRRDLLKDHTPWPSEEIRVIVDYMRLTQL